MGLFKRLALKIDRGDYITSKERAFIVRSKEDADVELDPKKIDKLMRCDICNKYDCICKEVTEPIGFKYE